MASQAYSPVTRIRRVQTTRERIPRMLASVLGVSAKTTVRV